MNTKEEIDKNKRQELITKIILEHKHIKQDEIISELKKVTGNIYSQSTISKDLNKLGIRRSEDNEGYILPTQDKRTLDIAELKKIATDYSITKSNIISNIQMMIIKIDELGDNHNLAKHLKTMYIDNDKIKIHDTISTNNSLIIFYSGTLKITQNDEISLPQDIESILTK